jgi:hypothetical protein
MAPVRMCSFVVAQLSSLKKDSQQSKDDIDNLKKYADGVNQKVAELTNKGTELTNKVTALTNKLKDCQVGGQSRTISREQEEYLGLGGRRRAGLEGAQDRARQVGAGGLGGLDRMYVGRCRPRTLCGAMCCLPGGRALVALVCGRVCCLVIPAHLANCAGVLA